MFVFKVKHSAVGVLGNMFEMSTDISALLLEIFTLVAKFNQFQRNFDSIKYFETCNKYQFEIQENS